MEAAGRLMSYYYLLATATIICCFASNASSSSGSASLQSQSVTCHSCMYYANIRVSINNRDCIAGQSIETVRCPPGFSCKVTFLQDSLGSIVHASRSCEQPTGYNRHSSNASVVLNARTTMYCRQQGCNNNWAGAPSRGQQGAAASQDRLHCWAGHGRHIDQFKLLPCSQKILRMTNNNGTIAQSLVCLLTQFTRQIQYNGRQYESAMYKAECAPHASTVYGTNYPMFEYERVCRLPGCNSGPAAERLDAGLMKPTANSASTKFRGSAQAPFSALLLLAATAFKSLML